LFYLLLISAFYHLPWSVREPVYRQAPQLHRFLMRNGYKLMQGMDELALWGRDAEAPVDGSERGEQVYGGFPDQGFQWFGRVARIENRGYCVGYSDSMKNPLWVAYRIFDVPKLSSGKRPSGFRIDSRTRARVRHSDYTRSGYDRGHMAPNYGIATRYGRDAQKETFLMSNVIPQTPRVNRGIWKDLEMRVAKRYGRHMGEVWVITGPVFEKPVKKLQSGVPIPSHYYKIMVDEQGGNLRALAFLIEKNCPPYTRISQRLVSIDELERRTGLDFFPDLNEGVQQQLESESATRLWPWVASVFHYYFK